MQELNKEKGKEDGAPMKQQWVPRSGVPPVGVKKQIIPVGSSPRYPGKSHLFYSCPHVELQARERNIQRQEPYLSFSICSFQQEHSKLLCFGISPVPDHSLLPTLTNITVRGLLLWMSRIHRLIQVRDQRYKRQGRQSVWTQTSRV